MNGPVQFLVTNNVTENTGQQVLVFLAPTDATDSEDFNFSAWQVLNPSANGGSQPFLFQDTIQLAVENANTLSRSSTLDVTPNQFYTVSNENNQGPVLKLTNQTPPSSKQVAIQNATDPAIMLNSIWSVNGNPIVSQGGLNLRGITTFELASTLFFMVAIPTRTGFNYRLQQFSSQTRYVIPQGVTQVNVTWSRPGGINGSDVLTFDPPSAPGIELAGP